MTRLSEETLRLQVAAELQRREREERLALESIYDWYGLSCPCNLPPGECKIHKRARLKQRPPDRIDGYFQPPDPDWYIWFMMAGRGAGKTQGGAKFVNDQVEKQGVKEVVLVNATIGDTRDIMVLGISGLVQTSPPWCKAVYLPSRSQVEWRKDNGEGDLIARGYLRTSEVPDGLRGLNASLVWGDEPGKWFQQQETWNQIGWILRNDLFPPPRCVMTGTPTPTDLMFQLDEMSQNSQKTKVYIANWHMLENATHLHDRYKKMQMETWDGTLMGQQELAGIIIQRREGALWKPEDFQGKGFAISQIPENDLEYIGVGVDPSGSGENKKASDTGIVVAARLKRHPGSLVSRALVLDDRSLQGSPGDWGAAVVRAYYDWGANAVIAEKNQGGQMVQHVINTVPEQAGYPSGKNVPVELVWASTGKMARAEPIQALYQAGRVQHLKGKLDLLERQMIQYLPGKTGQKLDRVDALVWILFKSIVEPDSLGDSGPIQYGLSREEFVYQGMPMPWTNNS